MTGCTVGADRPTHQYMPPGASARTATLNSIVANSRPGQACLPMPVGRMAGWIERLRVAEHGRVAVRGSPVQLDGHPQAAVRRLRPPDRWSPAGC